jgi:hypothetical protein
MTRPTKATAAEPEAADRWDVSLDTDPAVAVALAACARHSVSLSGSRWEKAMREVRKLDRESYALSGARENDVRRLATWQGQTEELRRREAWLAVRNLPVAEVEAARLSMARNIQRLTRRIAAGGDGPSQARRLAEVRRLTDEKERIETLLNPHAPTSLAEREALYVQLDKIVSELVEAQAPLEAGAVALATLAEGRAKAEREARAGLATTVRTRVMQEIAATICRALDGKTRLYRRLPDKPWPAEVKAALNEAREVCQAADHLVGEETELAALARLLGDEVRSVLFPGIQAAWRPRPDGIAAINARLDREIGAGTLS